MKQTSKQESGLAHIGLIIAAILVVAALAFAGWWVWEKNQKKDAGSANQSSQKESQNEDEKTNDPSEGGKYLVISEWGVRFPLPEELRGDLLTYVSNGDASGMVIFASKRLNSLVGDSSCDLTKQPNGSYAGGIQASLNRINPKTYKLASLEYYRSQHDYLETVGDYEYYNYKSPKSPPITCLTGQHEEFNDVEQSISNQLKEAFTKLETVN